MGKSLMQCDIELHFGANGGDTEWSFPNTHFSYKSLKSRRMRVSQMKTGYEWQGGNTKRGMHRQREREREQYAQTGRQSDAIKTNKFFHKHKHDICVCVSMCACMVCVAVNSEIDIIFHKAEKWFQL